MDEVTAAQAAALTGFSERTIRRRIASGALPARRLAANRYAIAVGDLPQRWDDKDLARRLDGLERRVRLLESGPSALLARLDSVASESVAAGQGDASISTLRELLIQLAHETDRLGPLFSQATVDARQQARGHNWQEHGSRRGS